MTGLLTNKHLGHDSADHEEKSIVEHDSVIYQAFDVVSAELVH